MARKKRGLDVDGVAGMMERPAPKAASSAPVEKKPARHRSVKRRTSAKAARSPSPAPRLSKNERRTIWISRDHFFRLDAIKRAKQQRGKKYVSVTSLVDEAIAFFLKKRKA